MKRKKKSRWELFGFILVTFIVFVVFVVFVVGGIYLGIKSWADNGGASQKSEKVAQLQFSLNGVSLEEMKNEGKEKEYFGNKLVMEDERGAMEFENVKVEGRGNTTWTLLKKPWQIKLNKKEELLEGREAKKWVLLANYVDTSFVRNDTALKLAEMIGMDFAQRGEFVELLFDGENEGLYYLIPKVEIEKGGVELRDELGVLVELDDLHGIEENDGGCYTSYRKDCLLLEDAVSKKDEKIKAEAMEKFLKKYIELEIAIENNDFEKVKELANIESLAEYFLLNEFTVNPDAYVTSFYFYKDGDEDKIHAGPVWDFDFALANQRWNLSKISNYYSPTETMILRGDAFSETGEKIKEGMTYLMYDLMEFPEFQEEIKRVFREKLSGRKQELLIHYDLTVGRIKAAAEQDITRWQEEEPLDKDFATEVVKLRDWIATRYDYFERIYGMERQGGRPSPL